MQSKHLGLLVSAPDVLLILLLKEIRGQGYLSITLSVQSPQSTLQTVLHYFRLHGSRAPLLSAPLPRARSSSCPRRKRVAKEPNTHAWHIGACWCKSAWLAARRNHDARTGSRSQMRAVQCLPPCDVRTCQAACGKPAANVLHGGRPHNVPLKFKTSNARFSTLNRGARASRSAPYLP